VNGRALLLLCAWGCTSSAARDGGVPAARSAAFAAAIDAGAPLFDPGDVARRLKKWAPVRLSADLRSLTVREKAALRALRRAADALDRAYWRQIDRDALSLRVEVASLRGPGAGDLRTLFDIHYGPYDQLDRHTSFYGVRRRAPEGAFYPRGFTREGFQALVARAAPAVRAALESPTTVLAQRGAEIVAVPYALAYRRELEDAARALEEAAGLVPSPSLARFLRLRARALRTNDYRESEIAWLDVKDSRIDVTLGPYETDDDTLLGLKASFTAVLGVRDEALSRELAVYARHLADLDRALPYEPPARKATYSPIVVIDQIYATGDARRGMQGMAFNLPNDERIQREKGSKKVLKRNVGRARFHQVALPIAERLLEPAQAKLATFEAFFLDTLMHELCHGLGPGEIRKDGRSTTVQNELKNLHGTLEEAKADMAGLLAAHWFFAKGILPQRLRPGYHASVMASILRTVRLGLEEDHGRSNLIELNYFLAEGAVRFDPAAGRYAIVEERFEPAARKLASELLDLQLRADYERARRFIERYGRPSGELRAALRQVEDIPVDFVPSYELNL
jgi:hypothetical protein